MEPQNLIHGFEEQYHVQTTESRFPHHASILVFFILFPAQSTI